MNLLAPYELVKRLHTKGFPSVICDRFLQAQSFDFGEVPIELVVDEGNRIRKALLSGCLRLPFDNCIFRVQMLDHEGLVREVFVAVSAVADRGEKGLPAWVICMGPDGADSPGEYDVTLFSFNREQLDHRVVVAYNEEGMGDEDRRLRRLVALSVTSGLVAILNTKGVRIETNEPDPVENKKRRKEGRAPLHKVTYVNARHFFEATANSKRGGTHASPVPHRRRGHLRREHVWCGQTRPAVWVPDCIVNVRSISELDERETYKVRSA